MPTATGWQTAFLLTPTNRAEFARFVTEHQSQIRLLEITHGRVLGRPHRAGDRAVDILVHKLRGKLGSGAIVTIRGAGYAFQGCLPTRRSSTAAPAARSVIIC